MPICRPVWIAEYICAILFSRIRLRIAGVPIMISCAAQRPAPSLVLRSVCEMTARIDSERSEEHTSELQSRLHLVCRLLLEKKKNKQPHVSQRTHSTSELVK